ncbi:MAG TPA: autotransporter domain-containing protein [Chthoniobacteraceae bacterium]|nr:autotransporter domain-containing protein [Chthoniobacteraceae bacterium]
MGAVFTFLLAGNHCHAQYTLTGTNGSGGSIVIGSGSLPALGPGAPLSTGGFNQVTLEPGSQLTSNPPAAIQITVQISRVVVETVATGGPIPTVTFPRVVEQQTAATTRNGISFDGPGNSLANNGAIVVPGGGAGIYFSDGDSSTVTGPGPITVSGGGGDVGILMASGSGAMIDISGPIHITGNGIGIGINFSSSGDNAIVVDSGPIHINVADLGYGINFGSGDGASVTTSGPITIAGQGYGIIFGSGNNAVVNTSSAITIQQGGYGIMLGGGDGAVVKNSGPISVLGGPGGNSYSAGIYLGSGNNALVVNSGPLLVTGGIEGIGFGSGNSATVINSAPVILASTDGGTPGFAIAFGLQSRASGAQLINSSTVWVEGDGDSVAFLGGNSNSLTNSGLIGLSGHGNAVVMGGDNNTITNWGAIQGGVDNTAILVSGNNNVVNLNGHSSVHGLISAVGSNNILNIDFTGMSPAAQAALKAQLNAQGNLNNFTGTFTVRGNTYTVDPMAIHLNLSSYQLQAVTPNQAAIGASLDSLIYNPSPGTSLANLLNAIDNSGNVPGALEELSPQMYAMYGDLAIENSDFMVQSLDDRLNNLRNGSESIAATGLGTQASINGAGADIAGWSKDDGKQTQEAQAAAPQPDRWGFFAFGDGLFHRGNYHDIDGRENARSNSAGTIVGVDGLVSHNGVLGAFFGYNNAAVELDGHGSHAQIESYSGGIYSAYHQEGFYLNSVAAYTRNDYNSNRAILLPGFAASADGGTHGDQATVDLDGGYDWNANDRVSVGPLIGVQYVHLGIGGFNEGFGGGGAALSVGSQDVNSLQSRLGARVNYHISTSKDSALALDLHAAWQHEYLDGSRGIGASFESGGMAPFAVETASPMRDSAVVGVNFNATFHNRFTLFAGYDIDISNSSYFNQSVNGGARISW